MFARPRKAHCTAIICGVGDLSARSTHFQLSSFVSRARAFRFGRPTTFGLGACAICFVDFIAPPPPPRDLDTPSFPDAPVAPGVGRVVAVVPADVFVAAEWPVAIANMLWRLSASLVWIALLPMVTPVGVAGTVALGFVVIITPVATAGTMAPATLLGLLESSGVAGGSCPSCKIRTGPPSLVEILLRAEGEALPLLRGRLGLSLGLDSRDPTSGGGGSSAAAPPPSPTKRGLLLLADFVSGSICSKIW